MIIVLLFINTAILYLLIGLVFVILEMKIMDFREDLTLEEKLGLVRKDCLFVLICWPVVLLLILTGCEE